MLPHDIGTNENSLKSISGAWEVSFIAKDQSFGSAINVADGSEESIPMSEEIELNAGEALVVSLTP